jgi:hypothetical protein
VAHADAITLVLPAHALGDFDDLGMPGIIGGLQDRLLDGWFMAATPCRRP